MSNQDESHSGPTDDNGANSDGGGSGSNDGIDLPSMFRQLQNGEFGRRIRLSQTLQQPQLVSGASPSNASQPPTSSTPPRDARPNPAVITRRIVIGPNGQVLSNQLQHPVPIHNPNSATSRNQPRSQQQQQQIHALRQRNISGARAVRVQAIRHLQALQQQQQQSQNQQQSNQSSNPSPPQPTTPTAALQNRPQQTIRIPAGARQIQVGPNGTVRITGHVVNSNNNSISSPLQSHMPNVTLPPLVPQPLPMVHQTNNQNGNGQTSSDDENENSSSNNNNDDDDEEEHDEFRCPVCFEFLDDPVSCGHEQCASRFCHACLFRVINNRASNTISRCPTCRNELQRANVVRDRAIQQRLQNSNLTVTCPYEGCTIGPIPISEYRSLNHPDNCPHCPMRCRYATLGCTWRGKRMHLEHHEQVHCALSRIGPFVQQMRQMRADHQHAILMLQQRTAGIHTMWDVHSHILRRFPPHPSNIFYIVNAVYTMACTPAHFVINNDFWRHFYHTAEARAQITNAVYMFPLVVNTLRSAVFGYRRLLSLRTDDEERYLREMEWCVLVITPFFLLVTIILCLFTDRQSSSKWSDFQFHTYFKMPIFRYLCILTSWLTTCVILECDELGGKAFGLWLISALTVTIFPPFVATFLNMCHNHHRVPDGEQILRESRCSELALFALRYGISVTLLGLLPTIDGEMVLEALASSFPRLQSFAQRHHLIARPEDSVWSHIPSEVRTGFVVIRLAVCWATQRHEPLSLLENSIAIFFLPLLHYTIYCTTALGVGLGTYVHLEGRSDVLQNQAGVRKDFSPVGLSVFFTYVTLLGILAIS